MTNRPVPAHTLLHADGASPDRWMLFLHGILGQGANWRSFARRLITAFPTWGAVLVDLRAHGASVGFPPPHTVREAAIDLESLDETTPGPIAGVLGHSFGGKVALAYLERRPSLQNVFVLDSTPGPRPTFRGSEGTVSVVNMLRELDRTWPSRKEFVAAVVARNHEAPFAEWLAQNLHREGEAFRVRLDMNIVDALLADYFALDLWPTVEREGSTRIAFVAGESSNVLDEPDRAHIRQISASTSNRVSLEVLENAGHWLHTDNPDGLFAMISRTM